MKDKLDFGFFLSFFFPSLSFDASSFGSLEGTVEDGGDDSLEVPDEPPSVLPF